MNVPNPADEPDIARIAALLGDPSRASICLALMDGRPLAAGELALRACISAQTASNHLAKLMGDGLVTVESVGRHRFYRLAKPDVARVIEALAAVAPVRRQVLSPPASRAGAFRFARTCYDHLAGRLGVGVTGACVEKGWLRRSGQEFLVTAEGRRAFADFDIDVKRVREARRSFARWCVDWSERRPHLAGALGASVLDRLLERAWVERLPRTRVIRLTPKGRDGLFDWLGLKIAE